MNDRTNIIDVCKTKIASGDQLNREDAVDLIRWAVEKRGKDYVYVDASGIRAGHAYASCRNVHYTSDGAVPGCINGMILSELYGIDRVPAQGSVEPTLETMGVDEDFSWPAIEALSSAQVAQDSGYPYGYVLNRAEES